MFKKLENIKYCHIPHDEQRSSGSRPVNFSVYIYIYILYWPLNENFHLDDCLINDINIDKKNKYFNLGDFYIYM